VKTSFSDTKALISETREKIILTKIVLKENSDIVVAQLPPIYRNYFKENIERIEFVLFVPITYALELLNYINNDSINGDKVSFVLWTYTLLKTDINVISIPYISEQNVKMCKNYTQLSCHTCLCLHESSDLRHFINDSENQNLPLPQIMPSARKYLDPAATMIALLSHGMLFYRGETDLTKSDIKCRINRFLSEFNVISTIDEAEHLFAEMVKARILLKTQGSPLDTYHLNSEIKRTASGKIKELEDAVIERVIKNVPQHFKPFTQLKLD
jgi:hypothetical protein